MQRLRYSLRRNHPTIISVFALVIALTSAGAWAGTNLIDSKDIRNGSIKSADIHKNGVRSTDLSTGAVKSPDIKAGAVQSTDIGTGEVQPEDVTLPAPNQCQRNEPATIEVGDAFAPVLKACDYNKLDADSILQVDWTGTAEAGFLPCIFQLRVDGQPSAVQGGELFVSNGDRLSVSATALFGGLPIGPHSIEIWVRARNGSEPIFPCTVGPEATEITQTFVVTEQVT